jgi:ribosomal protein S18 acetylase RimI-like enzyme
MDNRIQIHPAMPKDAAIIAQLGQLTFRQTFGHLFSPEALNAYLNGTFDVEKIYNSLQKPSNRYFLAYFEKTPIGYAKVKIDSTAPEIQAKRPVQLQKLYILQDFIAKNIGAALLKQILEMPEVQASDPLWLVVLQSNERAIRFYEKFGFANHCEYFHQIGATQFDYFILTKNLPK